MEGSHDFLGLPLIQRTDKSSCKATPQAIMSFYTCWECYLSLNAMFMRRTGACGANSDLSEEKCQA
jgi:hypothetical protein